MTRLEYDNLQDTILDLMEQEKRYCANYIANNPGDRKRRENIRDYILDGLQSVLSSLHDQAKTGKISIEG